MVCMNVSDKIAIYSQLIVSPNRNDETIIHILLFLLEFDRAKVIHHMWYMRDPAVVTLLQYIIQNEPFEEQLYEIIEKGTTQTKQALHYVIRTCLKELRVKRSVM